MNALLTPEALGRLASYGRRVALSVSLDGPERVHDAARGQGRFREAMAGLKGLRKPHEVALMRDREDHQVAPKPMLEAVAAAEAHAQATRAEALTEAYGDQA